MKSHCERARRIMPLELTLEASEEESTVLREHLEGCLDCGHHLQELESTLALLGSLPEVDPPRDFFVPAPPPRVSPAAAFGLLSPAWRVALAATLGALLLGLPLLWTALGASANRSAARAEAVAREEVGLQLARFEARLERRDMELVRTAEAERSRLRGELQQDVLQLLEASLADHEQHMEDRWVQLREEVGNDAELAVGVALATYHESWRRDLEELSLAVRLSLARNAEQERHMATMTQAFLASSRPSGS